MYEAKTVKWRSTPDSSNVEAVGWDDEQGMYVQFKSGTIYRYLNVSRQRVVAAWRAGSVGEYVNRKIKPNHTAVRVV